MKKRLSLRAILCACVGLGMPLATQARPDDAQPPADKTAPLDAPSAATLVTASYTDTALRQIVADLASRTKLTIRPFWADSADPMGMNPDAIVTLTLTRVPIGTALDLILRSCDASPGQVATWQITEDGAVELGSRTRLNRHPVLKIYDIRDLLALAPDFSEGATLDLAASLAGAQSGSILRDPDRAAEQRSRSRTGQADDLIELITQTIETEQWADNGGTAATIRRFQSQLVVVAPAYIHRQLLAASRAEHLATPSK